MKILSLILQLSGTYLISKSVFLSSIKKLINYFDDFKKLPILLKILCYFFLIFSHEQFKKIFFSEDYPSKGHFPINQQVNLTLPMFGFLLLALGIGISLYAIPPSSGHY